MSSSELTKGVSELQERTLAAYKKAEAGLLEQLRQIRAVLAALGEPTQDPSEQEEQQPIRKTGTLPPMYHIMEYLRERGKRASQSDIIRAVGQRRATEYPWLTKPYFNVWKSLEYHDRHDRKVVCVRMDGDKIVRTELVPKPKNPRVKGGSVDRPEFYEGPANLFYFRPAVEPKQRR
jgi:hypothetical protein